MAILNASGPGFFLPDDHEMSPLVGFNHPPVFRQAISH